ncbi:hypothetical protein EGI22_02810 [Lacihabitans sp. LS3-19]|uniref:CotH kinase family protein n=1 Tax=Lacihabitans sp. LS3-19 TaxID=2487335 RepID=UPI0020CD85C3|nr:CotH kinase family protein [Lacihabitans sp. LS3-19]MCP9766823.1 hypothetical protein [Lacihabitans sp. LS3-19]
MKITLKIRLSFIIFFCFFNQLTLAAQNKILESGSIWKFYDLGSLDNSNWKENTYNTSIWQEGPSELGYGDGDESTTLGYGGNPNNKYITTYFKNSFYLSSSRQLNCQIKMDDGAVVYLNGVEVYRNGLPSGEILSSTLAVGFIDENNWYSFSIPANLVEAGTNVFAVEIHQNSISSSDISFDLTVTAQAPPPVSGIYINEIMADNSGTISDNSGSFSDWFEIFNNTNAPFDLSNYYITDSKSNLTKYQFPNNPSALTIPPLGYKIIWASGETLNGPDHVSWSLSKNGEFVGLINPDGITVLDSLSFPSIKTDLSFGRLKENIDSLVYFSPASPNFENQNSNAYSGFIQNANFDMESGFYQTPFSVNIPYSVPHSTIYYTLDCSDPNPNNITPVTYSVKNRYPQDFGEPLYEFETKSYKSFLYTSALAVNSKINTPNYFSNFSTRNSRYPFQPEQNIPKATVIRSITVKPGFLSSDIQTKTYFIKDENAPNNNVFTLPVISLNTQENNLFGYNNGIMTPGAQFDNYYLQFGWNFNVGNYMSSGNAWERSGNFEFFKNNNIIYNEKIDIRIHGNSSRAFSKKGFRVYFNSNKKLFPNDPNKESKTILIKNPSTLDVPCHDLSMRVFSNLNIQIQKTYPAISFVNGEYWGIYNVMDHINDNYLENKYDLPKENFDVYKDGYFESGSENAKNQLITFLNNYNFSNQSNYDSLTALVDMENFTEMMISEIYSNNTDWPVNNTFLWRYQKNVNRLSTKSDLDGRWRWILIDFDATLYSQNDNALFRNMYNSSALESLILRKALENNDYKNSFINRFSDLLNTHFKYSRTSVILNTFKNEYLPELQKDYDRWEGLTPSVWLNRVNNLSAFFLNRNDIQINQLKDHFNLSNTYELNIIVQDSTQGFVKVNTIDINSTTPGINENWPNWTGTYFSETPVTIIAKPKIGYKFLYWILNGQNISDSLLTINLNSNISYTAIFEQMIISENPFPVSYTLAQCPYKFSEWLSTSTLGSFPNSMAFCYFNQQDPTLESKIEGFTNGLYNHGSKSRISGLNELGVSFINTNSSTENAGYPNGKLGGAILALNTIGLDTVKLTWKARTITVGSRKYALRLQYREGDLLQFKDFNPVIEYLSSNFSGDSSTFKDILLPTEILNKPYIQLIWKYYYTGIGTTGSRDQLAIDDIEVKTIKTIFSDTSNYFPIMENYSNYYTNSEIGGISELKFVNSALLLPGTVINNGDVILIEQRVCEE